MAKKIKIIDACKSPEDDLFGQRFIIDGAKFTIIYRGPPKGKIPEGIDITDVPDVFGAVCYVSLNGQIKPGHILMFTPNTPVTFDDRVDPIRNNSII